MTTLLEIQGLTKRFGPFTAVDGVSFNVERGEMVGFLGPNGAGKSTTMRMATGYLPPSSGTARIAGHDVTAEAFAAKSRLGYLPEGAPAYGDMTPASLLHFVADLRRMGREKKPAIDRVVERLQLGTALNKPVDTLSKGFKRRVGLAQAILHKPDLLILDEPTDGLDPNQKQEVRSLLAEMASDTAIVISTHILEEVEALCTRAIVIAQGKVIADATPTELEARSRWHNAVGLRTATADTEKVEAALSGLDQIADIKTETDAIGAKIVAFPKQGSEILAPVQERLQAEGVTPRELFVERGRLDDVFRDLTKAA